MSYSRSLKNLFMDCDKAEKLYIDCKVKNWGSSSLDLSKECEDLSKKYEKCKESKRREERVEIEKFSKRNSVKSASRDESLSVNVGKTTKGGITFSPFFSFGGLQISDDLIIGGHNVGGFNFGGKWKS